MTTKPRSIEYSNGEWEALMARVEHIHQELKALKYDLTLWARMRE